MKIAVLVSGGGTNLQAIIDAIASGKITNTEIALVISNKEGAYALKRAEQAGIKGAVISPKNYGDKEAYSQDMIKTIKDAGCELIVLAGFLVVLPESFVNAFEGKIINIHPSLIPSFCGDGFYGLKVHEKALERGVKVTGATVHYVDSGTDTGPIIDQKAVYIKADDTPETLQRRVMEEAEWVILPKAIDDIANHRI
ncbi:MAG: phosphoribosylglycinamide formyltransferase [Lachnospiraceae bacterium]|nr:phosphoribosylglycinamide formyltransferase [Lachnospiraceae bacterium]MDY4837182.1 phosphoribosylglycinamide formyltransferase [Lachnospiraceae bacterium]MDY5640219.1 phosphoribosylglycinamide formyltransferase [Lachnospiraceae bacterium]